jgi:DNA-binding PadR family transcriptional regulator
VINAYRRRRYERNLADDWRVTYALRNGARRFVYDLHLSLGLRPSRIYRSLTRLEQAGLVANGWEDKPVRPRRWYQLTPDGLHQVTPQVMPS